MNINDLGTNLTGGQIQAIMDTLLYESVNPIFTCTSYLDDLPGNLISNIVRDGRRKISAIPTEEVLPSLCESVRLLATGDKLGSFKILSKSRIERNIWVNSAQRFLILTEDVPEIYRDATSDKDARLLRIGHRAKTRVDRLFSVRTHVYEYLAAYTDFKVKIVRQYINMAHQYANTYFQDNGSLSREDMVQSLIAAISKALDKYSSDKGAVTSYIKFWMLNVRTGNEGALSNMCAFDVPNSHKIRIARGETENLNYSSELTDKMVHNTHEADEHDEDQLRILRLIKLGDPTGVYRLANGITETFSASELALMKAHTVRSRTPSIDSFIRV